MVLLLCHCSCVGHSWIFYATINWRGMSCKQMRLHMLSSTFIIFPFPSSSAQGKRVMLVLKIYFEFSFNTICFYSQNSQAILLLCHIQVSPSQQLHIQLFLPKAASFLHFVFLSNQKWGGISSPAVVLPVPSNQHHCWWSFNNAWCLANFIKFLLMS